MAELNELADKIAKIKQEVQTELEKLENSKSVYEYKKVILDGKTGKIGLSGDFSRGFTVFSERGT